MIKLFKNNLFVWEFSCNFAIEILKDLLSDNVSE